MEVTERESEYVRKRFLKSYKRSGFSEEDIPSTLLKSKTGYNEFLNETFFGRGQRYFLRDFTHDLRQNNERS